MPIYSRRNTNLSVPGGSDIQECDRDNDFLLDPEQFRDILPQPFRMINKVLSSLIDYAWEIIADREKERIEEASKIRPPQYHCKSQLEEFGEACSMCSSRDGQVVFLGLHNGLAAVDALTQQSLAVWEDNSIEITNMHTALLAPDYHIITTIDDMGVCRIFAHAFKTIFLLQVLTQHDSGEKYLASKCEPSRDGGYLGLFLESADNKHGHLEVYKCPKDVWLKEMEAIIEKSGKGHDVPTNVEVSNEGEDQKESEEIQSQTGTPRSMKGDKALHKFTHATVAMKIRPPTHSTGVTWSSPMQLAKTIDMGDVIGTGSIHQVSGQHLEMRWDTFRHFHRQHLPYINKEEPSICQPTFHFLTPGNLMSQGADKSSEQPTTLGVWWSNHYQFLQYSLVKHAKAEGEHKPDLVWPHSSAIVTSCVTPCTSLLALALSNNSVIVWNKYFGHCQQVCKLELEAANAISKLTFLDPSVCPQEERSNHLDTRSSVYLLVCCTQGQFYLITCSLGNTSPPRDVSTPIEKNNEQYTMVTCIEGIPELVLTVRINGRLYIHNILTGHVLCEVALPPQYVLESPWTPIVSLAGQGQVVFIRGKLREPVKALDEDDNNNSGISEPAGSVFVFHLAAFPTLNTMRTRQRPRVSYVTHHTVTQQINAIMAKRVSEQASRKDCMQTRWGQLKLELQAMKHTANKPLPRRLTESSKGTSGV